MSEQAVRAERLESRSTGSAWYLWEAAAKPLAVRLSLSAVERLEREALDSFRSVSSRGSEIGGVLLGSVSAGERPVVSVEDFETVACDYSRCPLYRLDENDCRRLDETIAAHQRDGRLRVVGFFRSNTRKGLSLDAEDLSLMGSRFRDPHDIALLIRPFATRASVGGIFVWDGGNMDAEASAQEFPFSAAELSKLAQPEASPAPRPAARGQIVPIASRREPVALPEPPPPEIVPVPLPVAEPKSAPEKAEPAASPEPIQPPPPAVEIPAPPMFGVAEDQPAPVRSGRLKWLLAAAGAAVLGTTLFVYPGFLRPGSRHQPAANPSAGLSLRAERTAGDLLIIWNRDAAAVRSASKAMLFISDGPQQESVTLDLAQLRNGSIVYTPATSDVSFRLEVTGSDPSRVASESVRVLRTRPSPLTTDEPAAPAQAAPAPTEAAEEPAPKPKTPLRPFHAAEVESPASRLRAARPTDLPEPPAPGESAGAPSLPTDSIPGGQVVSAPSAPPAPPPAAAKPQPPVQTPGVRVGGNVQPAELLTRREPVYPPLARQARIQGSVLVEARIDPAGKVIGVTALQGHPMLRPAALDAVKRWTYRPATLNGQAIESTSRVEVNFTAGQ